VDLEIPQDITIKPSKEFTAEVNNTMGDHVISYDKKPVVGMQPKRKNSSWQSRDQ